MADDDEGPERSDCAAEMSAGGGDDDARKGEAYARCAKSRREASHEAGARV